MTRFVHHITLKVFEEFSISITPLLNQDAVEVWNVNSWPQSVMHDIDHYHPHFETCPIICDAAHLAGIINCIIGRFDTWHFRGRPAVVYEYYDRSSGDGIHEEDRRVQ